MRQRLMWIAWPSFLMAGVLELLVFAVVDPQDLNWFGHALDFSRQAVYTLSFFVFWLVIAISAAMSIFLSRTADEINHSPL